MEEFIFFSTQYFSTNYKELSIVLDVDSYNDIFSDCV